MCSILLRAMLLFMLLSIRLTRIMLTKLRLLKILMLILPLRVLIELYLELRGLISTWAQLDFFFLILPTQLILTLLYHQINMQFKSSQSHFLLLGELVMLVVTFILSKTIHVMRYALSCEIHQMPPIICAFSAVKHVQVVCSQLTHVLTALPVNSELLI